jgi:hypothetical protein|tara:strand:+ start:126 stop:455 length:330 start_codon:yes stop_codon:yes gene_type:complete
MHPEQPFVLVRALPKADELKEFQDWFLKEHLPNIRKIPGIASIKWGTTSEGRYLGIYSFTDNEALQEAFASEEAANSRNSWDQWAKNLEDFGVEMMFPLTPPTMTLSVN